MMRALGIATIFLAFTAAFAAEDSMVELDLADGGHIRARLIQERPEKVFLDLGFSVLAVPREAIANLARTSEEASAQTDGELYRVQNGSNGGGSVKELVAQVSEAVVLVRTPTGIGSGFIIHPDGYIVTNDHVIAGEHEISVTVFKADATGAVAAVKEQYDRVRIVASTPAWDLALLKIEPAGGKEARFDTVPLGESGELRQGQPVFAIGNPLGLERSVSQGIVSARNRPIGAGLFIQATAQINPGNSGGPLFNLRGEVVGVNNMKVMAIGAEGLAFAIPTSVLKTFLRNRDAFAFDPKNPNSGFRYAEPPRYTQQTEDHDPED